MDKILRQLQAMKKAELIKMADEFKPPIERKKSWNTKQIAGAIRRRQKIDQEQQPSESETKPVNPAFEDALGLPEDPPKENRGGPRPGAGRPPGLTAEKAVVKNLPRQPNQSVKMFFEMLFNLWSEKVQVPEIALTENESAMIALPVTQLQEYYFPDAVPEIAFVWLAAAGGIGNVIYAKIQLIRESRKNKNAGSDSKISDRQTGIRQDGQGHEPDKG